MITQTNLNSIYEAPMRIIVETFLFTVKKTREQSHIVRVFMGQKD